MEEAEIAEGTPAGARGRNRATRCVCPRASTRIPLCVLRPRVSYSCRARSCSAASALSCCFIHCLNCGGRWRKIKTSPFYCFRLIPRLDKFTNSLHKSCNNRITSSPLFADKPTGTILSGCPGRHLPVRNVPSDREGVTGAVLPGARSG